MDRLLVETNRKDSKCVVTVINSGEENALFMTQFLTWDRRLEVVSSKLAAQYEKKISSFCAGAGAPGSSVHSDASFNKAVIGIKLKSTSGARDSTRRTTSILTDLSSMTPRGGNSQNSFIGNSQNSFYGGSGGGVGNSSIVDGLNQSTNKTNINKNVFGKMIPPPPPRPLAHASSLQSITETERQAAQEDGKCIIA